MPFLIDTHRLYWPSKHLVHLFPVIHQLQQCLQQGLVRCDFMSSAGRFVGCLECPQAGEDVNCSGRCIPFNAVG